MAASWRIALNQRQAGRNTKRIIAWNLLLFVEFAYQLDYNMSKLRLM